MARVIGSHLTTQALGGDLPCPDYNYYYLWLECAWLIKRGYCLGSEVMDTTDSCIILNDKYIVKTSDSIFFHFMDKNNIKSKFQLSPENQDFLSLPSPPPRKKRGKNVKFQHVKYDSEAIVFFSLYLLKLNIRSFKVSPKILGHAHDKDL